MHTKSCYISIRDPQLIKKIGDATALEVRATGIPYAFAPCIAVTKNDDELFWMILYKVLNLVCY